jgi:hypothetical protein
MQHKPAAPFTPPNRVVLELLKARLDFYERKVPELRRVRGKGGIFMRPTSPRPGPLPTSRRGRDARRRGRQRGELKAGGPYRAIKIVAVMQPTTNSTRR